jgi:CelD/BcsL family acetyltransferase involved in cellulose biosynthesis
MQFSILKDQSAFESLAPVWNQVLRHSITDVPFLRFEYLQSWWETLGGAEWNSGELYIGVGRDSQNEVTGIAPLFRPVENGRESRLMFIGSVEISDYLDLIVTESNLSDFTESMFQSLADEDRAVWERVDLYNLPAWSPSVEIITEAAQKLGWTITREIYQPCPMITLSGSWEDYLAGIKKKQRHELRRKMRRAESYSEPVRFHIVTKEEDTDEVIEAYLKLLSFDTRKQDFLSSAMRSNIGSLIKIAQDHEYLLLVFLYVGDTPAAAYMHFDYGNRIWVYNSGINPKYYDLSPGWVLLGKTIQWGIENGREALDFMRGDEVYKYRLGGVDRHVLRLTIKR